MNETPEQLRILLLEDTSADFDRNKQEGVSRPKSSVHNLEKSIVVTYCYGKSNLTDLAMFLDTHLQLYRRANNTENQCVS